MEGRDEKSVWSCQKGRMRVLIIVNRYFNKRNVISIPFEKNNILETLSDWCKSENLTGKGLIAYEYNTVDHFRFIRVNQKGLNNILDANPCLDNYSHYIAFSKDKGKILTIRVVEFLCLIQKFYLLIFGIVVLN